ncbi:MAG: hypothetical protein OEM24_00730 [Paracoccaceae bacterium]|nr:hypothetical protein [Paracoccaceae bacterium]
MAHYEAFHSSQGSGHFLGLRQARGGGGVEIVYDDGVARRMVWRVKTPGASMARIGEAMRVAAGHLRVVPALQAELRKRAISIEAVQR